MLSFNIIHLAYKNLVTHVLYIDLAKMYNLGFMLAIAFAFQILSGSLLLCGGLTGYYSVVLCDLESPIVWVRCYHISGTSAVFALLYLHVIKTKYYSQSLGESYAIYVSGALILVLSIVIAFLGYVIPMTQMSYWGLIVFGNIISSIKGIGAIALYWLWGGEFISNSSIARVLGLHVCLPYIIALLILLHIYLLHYTMSSSSLTCISKSLVTHIIDQAIFMDFAFAIDYAIVALALITIYWTIVFHEEAYIEANPLKTSEKIIPEWYFLVLFGAIKAFPSRSMGVAYMSIVLVALISSELFKGSSYSIDLHKTTIYGYILSSIVIIGLLASYVALMTPMIELLVTCNLVVVLTIFFKVF